MSLALHCNEIFDGCPGVVRAETEEEVLAQAADHAAAAHGLTEIDPETRATLSAAIREE